MSDAGSSAAIRPAIIEGVVEPGLLTLLLDVAGYGYELALALEDRHLVPAPLAPPRVYEALARLEHDGAIAGEDEASPCGPDRRRYTITRSGRARLDRWMEALGQSERSLLSLRRAYERQR